MNEKEPKNLRVIVSGIAKEFALFLKELLEAQGKQVEICSEPEELDPLAGKMEPCLLLMLWQEGKPEWEQALKTFQQKRSKSCRLLMGITPSREALKAARDFGAHDVILYPLQRDELFFRLNSLQNQLKLQQQLKSAEEATLKTVVSIEEKFYSMVGRLAHDFNTPLAAAYMNCNLLITQNQEVLTLTQQRTLEQLNFSLGELKRAIMATGDWVRLVQGQLKPTLQPIQWQELLEIKKEEWAELEALARRDQKKILVEATPGLPSALADKELIGRTMILLLYNALHYTGKGDHIKVKVAQDEKKENLLFVMEDTGQKMPAVLAEMIFEWGISREEHLKGLRWGRGVGLNYCKQAVEACGGKIWTESPPDRGCRFLFSLPLWKEPPQSS